MDPSWRGAVLLKSSVAPRTGFLPISTAVVTLVLPNNEPLAVKLDAMFQAKGLTDRVHVRNFHKWCRQQLVAFGQEIPGQGAACSTPWWTTSSAAWSESRSRPASSRRCWSTRGTTSSRSDSSSSRRWWTWRPTCWCCMTARRTSTRKARTRKRLTTPRSNSQERRHPSGRTNDDPTHQLPQHEADPADRQPRRRRIPQARCAGQRRNAADPVRELRTRWSGALDHPAAQPARGSDEARRAAGQRAPGRPRLRRHGDPLQASHGDGGMRACAEVKRLAPQGEDAVRQFRSVA